MNAGAMRTEIAVSSGAPAPRERGKGGDMLRPRRPQEGGRARRQGSH
jgi:hypothetical protein